MKDTEAPATALARLTSAQTEVLYALADVARAGQPYTMINRRFYSAASALVRKGYAEKIERSFYRPVYRLSENGRALLAAADPDSLKV